MTGNQIKILIVDDEPIIRQTLDALLNDSWCVLSFAENGEQGLVLAQQESPDAILLDIMMPDIDGYEVCRRLRAAPQLAEVPIIMMTALDDRESRLAGLLCGADDFLTKPFDGLELKIRLRTIMRVNRYRNLLAERARFSWIVEHAEDGYLLLNNEGQLQYANSKAQMFLHLPENYVGLNLVHHIDAHYQPHPAEKWDYWLDYPEPMYLVQPETATARPFWLLVDAMAASHDSENGRVVHLRDITEKMAIYQDTRKFHTIVAHKLRTPVSLIYSAMTLLDAKIDVIPTEEIKPLVKTAWNGAKRLVDTVRDILSYIDAPLAIQNGQPVTLDEFSNLLYKTGELLQLRDVTLSVPPGHGTQTMILTRHALELILTELLENSKKFHPQHTPHIDVKIELLPLQNIRLSIGDNGLTLTSEQLSWAWLPYFQSEKDFSGEIVGMGLGFPMVATLVWQVGGKVRLANRNPGPGVIVELTIPLVG